MSLITEGIAANNALRTIFKGADGDEITREKILENVGMGTFYNYMPLIYRHNLAEPVKRKRKTVAVRLTEGGKRVVHGVRPSAEIKNYAPSPAPAAYLAPEQPKQVKFILDEVTERVEEFNHQSTKWEWVLVRKGESPMAK